MDFYSMFSKRLSDYPQEWTVRDAVAQTVKILEEGPLIAGTEAGVALLGAIWTWKNAPEGVCLLPYYIEVKEELLQAIESAEREVETADRLTLEGIGEKEAEAPQEDPEEEFPDFDHLENLDPSKWDRWKKYHEETMKAARGGLSTMAQPLQVLGEIRDNLESLPMDRRIPAAEWAEELADAIYDRMEATIQEINEKSIYTPEGRRWQRILRRAPGAQEGGGES